MTTIRTLTSPRPASRTLLALHCSGAAGRVFNGYRARLDHGTTLVAPDLLGYGAGDTAWPVAAKLTLDAEAARLAPLLAAHAEHAGDGLHLLGHSYGGAVALQIALRWPQHVNSLTGYEPTRFALLADGDPELWDSITRVGRHIGELAASSQTRRAAELFVDYWSGPGAWSALPPARQSAVAARMPKVRAEFDAAFNDPLPIGAYAGLSMPVTVIAGGRSPAPARRVAERLAAACPNARLVRLPQLGHMGALEAPDAVLAQLPWAGQLLGVAA